MARLHKVTMYILDMEEVLPHEPDCDDIDVLMDSRSVKYVSTTTKRVQSSDDFEWDDDIDINKHTATEEDYDRYFLKKSPIPEYSSTYTMEKFVEYCMSHSFIDYDGFGKYSDGEFMYNKTINPSDIEYGDYDKKFSHVVWFNR